MYMLCILCYTNKQNITYIIINYLLFQFNYMTKLIQLDTRKQKDDFKLQEKQY